LKDPANELVELTESIRQVHFGYRAVAEQFPPQKLLGWVVLAEKHGFEFSMVSDHFHPWFHDGGHASFAWTWLASAAERTKTIKLGTGVTTPIYRYHPALIAQAFATLGVMYPGRISLGLGTGEAMNEVPLSGKWPNFGERLARLEESLKLIRALWESEDFVNLKGEYYVLKDAHLYERPSIEIPIYVAASGSRTAYLAGTYADGLYTTPGTDEVVTQNVLLPFRDAAKKMGRNYNDLRKLIMLNISWDIDHEKALNSILRWRATAYPGVFSKGIWDPRKLDQIAKSVKASDIAKRWIVCTTLEECIPEIERYMRLGFDEIEIRSCSPDEEIFIKKFGKEILSYFNKE
jgi:coenzyme F420-dependent glucose-6-phosphate dehydrogenase